MSNENYEKVVEWCTELIKEFESCGLKEDVLKRIFELVQWREKQKVEDTWIDDFQKLVFMDLRRAVNLAKSLSKKYNKDECQYFRKWLSLPFTEKKGLGYWAIRMSR